SRVTMPGRSIRVAPSISLTVAMATPVPASTMVALTSMSPGTDCLNHGTVATVASGGEMVASTATVRTTGPASSIFRPAGEVICVLLLEASVAVIWNENGPSVPAGGAGGGHREVCVGTGPGGALVSRWGLGARGG